MEGSWPKFTELEGIRDLHKYVVNGDTQMVISILKQVIQRTYNRIYEIERDGEIKR